MQGGGRRRSGGYGDRHAAVRQVNMALLNIETAFLKQALDVEKALQDVRHNHAP